jgi:acyl-CoA hydrolase
MAPRTVTPQEAVSIIASGQRVFIGSGAAEPSTLVRAMTDRAPELRGVQVFHILTLGEAPYVAPEYAENFRHTAFFIGHNVRQAVQDGRADFMPIFLGEIPAVLETRLRPDVALVQLSPPDKHGWCSVGVSADVVMAAIRGARHVVAEINPRMPRTWGNTIIHVSSLHAMVDVDTPLPELHPEPTDEISDAIGRFVAGLIDDGDCLQLGIGTVPNAVLKALASHTRLGVHTEMLSDGIVSLVQSGAIDCSRKNYHPGKAICSFAMGTRALYDFVDDNPFVEFYGNEFVNDPFNVSRNDRMVAVNSAIQVDLTGQVNADSFGTRAYSGIGGQVDFIRGASRSRGGKPIIALPSTARGGISRIVPTLAEGAGVVTSRGDVHFVATEYGVADLYARTTRERAHALIAIAHPDHRETLARRAHELRLA